MAYLQRLVELQFNPNISGRLSCEKGSKCAEIREIFVLDIGLVLLCEEVSLDPVPAALGNDDRAVQVLAQSFFEDAAQIVGLAEHHLTDGIAKLDIRDACLPRRLGKPGCLEDPFRPPGSVFHFSCVAPSAIEIKLPNLNCQPPRRFFVRPISHLLHPTHTKAL
jgi:hypothetical protein